MVMLTEHAVAHPCISNVITATQVTHFGYGHCRRKQFAVGQAKVFAHREKLCFFIIFIVMTSSPRTLYCTAHAQMHLHIL